jgi:hypothetical protein
MAANMIAPHCLIHGLDNRRLFQPAFEGSGNGFVVALADKYRPAMR